MTSRMQVQVPSIMVGSDRRGRREAQLIANRRLSRFPRAPAFSTKWEVRRSPGYADPA